MHRPFKTHYDNLKVSWDAPPEVIRVAYKALVNKYHPDRNPNCERSLRVMQIINASYEVLSDEAQRRDHDRWIAERLVEIETARTREQKSSPSRPAPPTTPRPSAPTPKKPPHEPSQGEKNAVLVFFVTIAAVFLLFAVLSSFVKDKPASDSDSPSTPRFTPSTAPVPASSPRPTQAAAPPAVPELPLPKSGQTTAAANVPLLAPFEIKSSSGTNYFVKLVDFDTGIEALTVFVRGGTPVSIKAPLGTYLVKYASGLKWYGEEAYFGPETQYSQADETFTFSRDISPRDAARLIELNRELAISDTNFKAFLISNGMSQKTADFMFDQKNSETEELGLDRLTNDWWRQNVFAKLRDVPLTNKIIDRLNARNRIANERNKLSAASESISGFTITLYKVANGNLQTSKISKAEF